MSLSSPSGLRGPACAGRQDPGRQDAASPDAGSADAYSGVPPRVRQGEFVATRLALAAAGLAGLPPLLAWRGGPTWLDALLALCLSAPLAAAIAVSRTGRLASGYGIAGAGVAGLVACVLGGFGPAAWPVLLLLAIEPLDALASGSRRQAVAALAGSALALFAATLMMRIDPNLRGEVAPAQIALAVLVLAALGHGYARSRSPAVVPAQPPALDRDLARAIGDLVTWHDRTGEVVRADGAARDVTGYEAAALLGAGLFARVHVPDRPAFLKALDDAGSEGGPVSVEFRLHRGGADAPDAIAGTVVWVEMRARRASRVGDSGGGVVAVIRDAAASRRHAEEIDAARREAERANELKGRFLANVSHELRTPLNAIIGFSELMTVDRPFVLTEERRREYATIIRDSGHHLLDIVNTLLDMSKIETGNFDFAPEPLPLGQLAQGCCDLIQIKAEQGGVRLEREIAPDLPEIVGDRRAFRQILINLLSNAVKFTPEGGRVTLRVAIDRDVVVLAVADTGIGIRAADLPRLGDPFFQVGDMHRRSHEGTGLGLSVVRGLVGLHGGAMSIESGFREGTCVTIRMPVQASHEGARGTPVEVATIARAPSADERAPGPPDGHDTTGDGWRMSA